MNKDLIAVFEYLEREKGIKRDIVIAAIEESLRAAALKSIHGASNVEVHIHPKTGAIEVFCDKTIVEKVRNNVQEVSLKEYSETNPDCQLGDVVKVAVTPRDFGRIAAQKARQIISQKLRGAERDVIHDEYRHRVGQLISGTVKRVGGGATVIVDHGKVEGVLPKRNYPPTEKYHVGDRVLAVLQEVRDTDVGGAEVILSRSSPDFVKQLLIQEVPELVDGTVAIEKIVREAGFRTKIVVRSHDPKVDPVGACIGMRGVRIKNVIRELHNEKIDCLPYNADKIQLLQQALDPVQIRKIRTNDEETEMLVVVADDDFGSAIGKKGLNVRLIGQLLDVDNLQFQKLSEFYRIDAFERSAMADEEDPTLDEKLSTFEGGISNLAIDQLIADERFDTPRKVLRASLEQLTEVPGISLDVADKIIEQIRKQRA
jgi:N utilization substance protein A